MKKKTFRSLAALALSTAVVMSLGACSNNTPSSSADADASDTSEEEVTYYVDVNVGDVVYSDDNCSVTIKSLETNDDGGSTLTLSLVSTYDTSVCVDVTAWDTDKYEKFINKEIETVNGTVCETYWLFTAEDDTEADAAFAFSDEYIYFSINVDKYSKMYTDEELEENGIGDDLEENLYYSEDVLKISTAE